VGKKTGPRVEVRKDADGVTVFTVTPEARPQDVVEAYSEFVRRGPTPLVLWDLRQGSFNKVTSDGLRSMVRRLILLSSPERTAGRSAFVVARSGDRGAVRTLILYAELGGYLISLEVFRDMNVAHRWLLGLDSGA
jgi:hypothetical protein